MIDLAATRAFINAAPEARPCDWCAAGKPVVMDHPAYAQAHYVGREIVPCHPAMPATLAAHRFAATARTLWPAALDEIEQLRARAGAPDPEPRDDRQRSVHRWVRKTFGTKTAVDPRERAT